MVLIMPEMRSHAHSPSGLTTAGLQASIRSVLESGDQGDLSRLHVRILGSYVIIEGLVESEESIPEIVALAEGVAGAGNVRLRVFSH
jgi:hypothetical protein